MQDVDAIRNILKRAAHIPAERRTVFYKTGKGDYAEHDRFLGVSVPNVRKIAKEFRDLPLEVINDLMASPFNEERLLALIILVRQYDRGDREKQREIFAFYLENRQFVNNWNLVDASAHLILGRHLFTSDKSMLLTFAKSESLWERRIAIVSTWYFITNDELSWTFKLAKVMLKDEHDLIHKAVGWMLREAGKRDQTQLVRFLEQHAPHMPRTMLRYAIEKFPEPQRKQYLTK
jgi:3-methyladenine DNA glycosylase AlkD